MLERFRIVLFIALLGSLILVLGLLFFEESKSPLGPSFSQALTVLGRGTRTVDRVVSQSLMLRDEDEVQVGIYFREQLSSQEIKGHPCAKPIDELLQNLAQSARRPLAWKAFVVDGAPNAMAFPGGAIAMTDQLLKLVSKEDQRAAILAHELGHIELRHSFDAVKFEMLAQRVELNALGRFFDGVFATFVRHSFSKTQEMEADQYAFDLMTSLEYPPESLAESFQRLASLHQDSRQSPSLWRDYIRSHPPIKQRIENFRELALRYRMSHESVMTKSLPLFSEGCETIQY